MYIGVGVCGVVSWASPSKAMDTLDVLCGFHAWGMGIVGWMAHSLSSQDVSASLTNLAVCRQLEE